MGMFSKGFGPQKTILQGSLTLLVPGLLIVGVIAASIISYLSLAQKEFEAGMASYQASDWPTAFGHFALVTDFYKFGASANLSEAQTLKEESSLLAYANIKLGQEDFAAALQAYATYRHLYPTSSKQPEVIERAGATYKAWIGALQTQQNYSEALNKVRELLLTYPGSAAAKSAESLPASLYLAWASDLRQRSEFASAIEKYEIIQSDYEQTTDSQKVKSMIAEVYAEWGQTLSAAGDYSSAIDKYRTLRSDFADQPAAQESGAALAELYAHWGNTLSQEGNYAAAIEEYAIWLNEFADQPLADESKIIAVETYLRYANELRETGHPTLAVVYASQGLDIFQKLSREHSGSLNPKQSELIRQAYMAIGQNLVEGGHFLGAIEVYADAKKLADDSTAQADWQAGYDAALHGLTLDSGREGQQVMADVLETACLGQPTNWAVVGSSPESPKARLCFSSNDFDLGGREATTPGSLHYVVDVETGSTTIQNCPYTGGHTLIRQRLSSKIIVYSAVTGTILSQTTLFGSTPPGCPAAFSFSSTPGSSFTFSGDDVSAAALLQAINQLLDALLR